MIKVDFHVHSTASDGLLSPREVVKRAYLNGVKYLALTDHDTLSGIQEAKEEGDKLGVTIIPGVELSTNHNGESIHILALFNDESYKNPKFLEVLNNIKNKRVIRAKKIVGKLKEEFDINISFENVLNRGKDVVARPHIAKEIISSGYKYDLDYIFDNFIGKGCKAYIPTNKLTAEDGVKIIHKFNGIAILAHPILIKNTPINEFLKMNFDGIEGVYYQNSQDDESEFIAFGREHNLLITAGSDCHGDFKNDSRHGDIGEMNLDDKFLLPLLKRLNL